VTFRPTFLPADSSDLAEFTTPNFSPNCGRISAAKVADGAASPIMGGYGIADRNMSVDRRLPGLAILEIAREPLEIGMEALVEHLADETDENCILSTAATLVWNSRSMPIINSDG
jgi:hypothetical protein